MILCYSQSLVASSRQTRKRGNSYSEHTLSRGHGHEIDQLLRGRVTRKEGGRDCTFLNPSTLYNTCGGERLAGKWNNWLPPPPFPPKQSSISGLPPPIKHLLPSFHQIESSTQTALSPDIPLLLSRRRRRSRRVANFLPRRPTNQRFGQRAEQLH